MLVVIVVSRASGVCDRQPPVAIVVLVLAVVLPIVGFIDLIIVLVIGVVIILVLLSELTVKYFDALGHV